MMQKRYLMSFGAKFMCLGLALLVTATTIGTGHSATRQTDNAAAKITHANRIWARLLETYAVSCDDGINRVRYAAWRESDREALDNYIRDLTAMKPADLRASTEKAFWINLYNALTIRVVLDHYPVESIRDIDISPGLFADGPWGAELITIDGRDLSLDDIEHGILREKWSGPRIHYAVNCASLGCPNLARFPYRGDRLDAQLNAQARAYINHPRGVSIEQNGLVLSNIFDWYAEDFGDSEAELIAHLRSYAGAPLRAKLDASPEIADYRYDWALNDVDKSEVQCR